MTHLKITKDIFGYLKITEWMSQDIISNKSNQENKTSCLNKSWNNNNDSSKND